MKTKLFVSLLLAGFLYMYSPAQDDFRIGLSLAPTINFNKGMVKVGDNFIISDSLRSGGLGFKGGMWADYGFAANYYIHSGLLIHQRNFKSDYSNMKITTVEIPLSLKMRSNEVADNIRLLGFFGFTLDFNVSGKADNIVITKDLKKIGTSLVVGTGAEYEVGFGNINLGLSYHLGMTDVMKSEYLRIVPRHLSIDFAFYFN